jgi:hypothetical protein
MATGTSNTAYLRLGVAPDGSAKASFLALVKDTVEPGKREAVRSIGELQGTLKQALSPPRTGQFAAGVKAELAAANREVAAATTQAQRNLSTFLRGGGGDLNVAELKAAAAAQQQRAAAARELATATEIAGARAA